MLYGVAQASLEETGGGEGVEVLKNEPYKNEEKPLFNGKYTEVRAHILIDRHELGGVSNIGGWVVQGVPSPL